MRKMGYQESFRQIEHLAEAAGIKKAIEDYEHHPDLPEYCVYYCASREKSTGKLYVCIGGQRCRVHILAGKDLDDCIPYEASYADYYEDFSETLVEEAARERPDLVDKGYRDAAAAFERSAEWKRKRNHEQRKAADALKPYIESFLKEYGPATSFELYRANHLEEHSMDDALAELSYRNYLKCYYVRRGKRQLYWFVDGAIAGSFEVAMASAPSLLEDRIERVLGLNGPSSVRSLSIALDASDSGIRKALQLLVKQSRAAVDKTGRSHVYRLVRNPQEDESGQNP